MCPGGRFDEDTADTREHRYPQRHVHQRIHNRKPTVTVGRQRSQVLRPAANPELARQPANGNRRRLPRETKIGPRDPVCVAREKHRAESRRLPEEGAAVSAPGDRSAQDVAVYTDRFDRRTLVYLFQLYADQVEAEGEVVAVADHCRTARQPPPPVPAVAAAGLHRSETVEEHSEDVYWIPETEFGRLAQVAGKFSKLILTVLANHHWFNQS